MIVYEILSFFGFSPNDILNIIAVARNARAISIVSYDTVAAWNNAIGIRPITANVLFKIGAILILICLPKLWQPTRRLGSILKCIYCRKIIKVLTCISRRKSFLQIYLFIVKLFIQLASLFILLVYISNHFFR